MRESIDDSHLPLIERSLIFEPSSRHTGTVIWLQGLGEDVDALKPLFQMIRSDSVKLIVPRANKIAITALDGTEERGWFDLVSEEMTPDMDEDAEGIEESAAVVRQLIEHEAQKLERGTRGIVLGGVAQGGALALHAGLGYDQPLAGIICYSSYLALPQQYPEHISQANSKCPLLLIHGRMDRAIPYDSFAKPRYDKLKGMSLPIETRVDSNMTHQLNASQFVQAMMWSKSMIAKR